MGISRTALAAVVVSTVVAGAAFAASAGSGVPAGSPAAVKAAFAHGPGPWKAPLDSAGSAKYSAWPNACQMLSLGVLKVLIPGTTSVKGLGQHGSLPGGGETPKFATCKYSLHGSYDPPASDGYPPSFIEVDLRGIFDTASNKAEWTREQQLQVKLAKKYPDQYGLYKGPNGAACFYDGNELQCMVGTWNYWIIGMFDDKTGSDAPALEKAFRTAVLVPAAFGLASRMR